MIGMGFTLFLSSLFILVSKNLYKLLYFFIFLLPFLPRYIGFGIGQEGSSLSLKRILLLVLLGVTSLFLLQQRKYLSRVFKVLKANKLLVWIFISVMFIQLASIIINGIAIKSIVLFINDFMMTFFMLFICTMFIRNINDITQLYKVITWSYLLVISLVLIEAVIQHPIYTVFASNQIQVSRDISDAFMRDGMYRVSASFTNPIVLGAFLVSMFSLILSYVPKKFILILLPIYLFCVYMTGSRGAILLTLILFYLYVFFTFGKRNRLFSMLLNILNSILIILIIIFSYVYISDLYNNFTNYMSFDTASERSDVSRALQFYVILDYIKDAFWLGHGRIVVFEQFKESFGASLDNYYIRVLAETGFIGLFLYTILMGLIVKYAFDIAKINKKFLPISLSVIVLVLYQFLLAIPYMWIYLYAFLGIMFNIKFQYKRGVKFENTFD